MKNSIFEILSSASFPSDELVVCMSVQPQQDGRVLVCPLGGDENNSRLIPVSDLKNYITM